ncbi:MAG TPA: ABC transporter substrate-binding protein [Sporichthya sp.]|nr:ABC transporter substrate-binding protein [Sporichthya sp.]
MSRSVPVFSHSSRPRGRWTATIAGSAALAVLLTGCGGTRESDEAIERAAGIGQTVAVPQADATGALPAGTTATGAGSVDTGTGLPATTGTAAVPGTTTGTAPGTASGAGPATTSGAGQGATTTATKPGAGAPAAATGPATKSVIKLGAVGTFSGPVGALVKDTINGIRVWQQWTNTHGGVNGHAVDVLVGDDGGDPARYISIQRQFVEKDGVVAFLYGTLGFSPNGNNKYLDSQKIFTFGTEGGLETAYNNPYVLTATPTGKVNADSILKALGDVARPLGKKKFAEFACSDFGLCDNFDQRWGDKAAAQAVGFDDVVARGRPSLTQPDYTAQCLAAKNAGAEVVMLALDTASLRRFAGDCARQNYKPIFGTADLLALSSLPTDPNVDGLIVAAKMAPWTDPSVPGIAEVTKAFAQYSPGALPTGGNTNGWILGQFFAAAGAHFPDGAVTKADVENGVYQIKNNNLQGMTFPITMTKGQPMKRQLCYGVVVIKGGQYAKYPGPALRCGALLPGASGSVEPAAVQQGAATRAALRKSTSAPASAPPVDAWLSTGAPAIVGVIPSRRLAIAAPAGIPVGTARPAAADSCGPARAAGFSYFLDAFQTGSSAGPGVLYGASLAVLGTPLPDPFATYQNQFIAEGATAVEGFSDSVPQNFQDSRSYFEPFAVYNDYGNAFIDAFADGMDTGADTFGSFIQPGDRSMREFAQSARDARATNDPCDAAVKSTGDKVLDALATAFYKGDTAKAIALIQKNNLLTSHEALATAIIAGGIAATEANNYEPFIRSVSHAFVESGITPADTGQTFAIAARNVAPTLTFEEGAVGFRTICETYALYLAKGKFS